LQKLSNIFDVKGLIFASFVKFVIKDYK